LHCSEAGYRVAIATPIPTGRAADLVYGDEPRRSMKKAVIAILVLCATGVGILLFSPAPAHHPDYYVSRGVMSPLPATLHHVKTLCLFEPSFGDGACVAAYSISAADFDLLRKTRPWASGFVNATFKPERYFTSVWPGTAPEFESYHFVIDQTQDVEMAVSKDHTKVIFSIKI
jgi:hypothetical protein